MSAPSPQTGCVIGVDLGGTKLLAGVVGPDLAVRHRVRRRAFGLDQASLMATIVEAVEEAPGRDEALLRLPLTAPLLFAGAGGAVRSGWIESRVRGRAG